MHHLSILVSVCMRMKECRIVHVALGAGAAVNSGRDWVPGWTAESLADGSPWPHQKETLTVLYLLERVF